MAPAGVSPWARATAVGEEPDAGYFWMAPAGVSPWARATAVGEEPDAVYL
jgi:hypothetical protein